MSKTKGSLEVYPQITPGSRGCTPALSPQSYVVLLSANGWNKFSSDIYPLANILLLWKIFTIPSNSDVAASLLVGSAP